MKKIAIFFTMIMVFILCPYTSFSDSDGTVRLVNNRMFSQYQRINVPASRSGDTMEKIKIEPFNKVYVNRDTRVNWTNYSDVPIRIKFGNGKKCRDIRSAPNRIQFWRLSKECYITEDPIPQNGVLQIVFDEPGKYAYEIQFVGTKITEKAEIVVFGNSRSMPY